MADEVVGDPQAVFDPDPSIPRIAFREAAIDQATADMICRVYREQFEAAHPAHEEAPHADDTILLAYLAAADPPITGGPEACALARGDAVTHA